MFPPPWDHKEKISNNGKHAKQNLPKKNSTNQNADHLGDQELGFRTPPLTQRGAYQPPNVFSQSSPAFSRPDNSWQLLQGTRNSPSAMTTGQLPALRAGVMTPNPKRQQQLLKDGLLSRPKFRKNVVKQQTAFIGGNSLYKLPLTNPSRARRRVEERIRSYTNALNQKEPLEEVEETVRRATRSSFVTSIGSPTLQNNKAPHEDADGYQAVEVLEAFDTRKQARQMAQLSVVENPPIAHIPPLSVADAIQMGGQSDDESVSELGSQATSRKGSVDPMNSAYESFLITNMLSRTHNRNFDSLNLTQESAANNLREESSDSPRLPKNTHQPPVQAQTYPQPRPHSRPPSDNMDGFGNFGHTTSGGNLRQTGSLFTEKEVASLETGGYFTEDPEPQSLSVLHSTESVASEKLREVALFNTTISKHHFAQAYKSVSRQQFSTYDYFHREGEQDPMFTVREYIRKIQAAGRVPWPVLLRQNEERILDVNHLGMGDDFGLALAHTIPMSPHLHTINVRDNRLGDDALDAIMEAICRMPNVTSVDLSLNEIGPKTSQRIRQYLGTANILKELYLDNADVDDIECKHLMESMGMNLSLTRLNLGDNLIGAAENMNVVQPDFITGGESIAEMLSVNVHLVHLDLRWNSIRGESAKALGRALENNETLKTLLLAHNAFANDGSQELAQALTRNHALTYLDLSFNAVQPAAALVFSAALRSNTTLTKINLDGNKVGSKGGAALVAAVRKNHTKDRELHISMKDCDTVYDNPTLFSVEEPGGQHTLQLTDPYQRMVAEELLRIANTRDGCSFSQLIHIPNPKKRREKKTIKLIRKEPSDTNQVKKKLADRKRIINNMERTVKIDVPTLVEFALTMNLELDFDYVPKLCEIMNSRLAEAVAILKLEQASLKAKSRPTSGAKRARNFSIAGGGLRSRRTSMATKRVSRAGLDKPALPLLDIFFQSLFSFVDSDGSGYLSVDELMNCLQIVGIETDADHTERIISTYDVDKSGALQVDEFVTYMTKTYGKALQAPKECLIDESGKPWEVPKEGILKLNFVAEPSPPSYDEVGTNAGVQGLIENLNSAANASEKQRLFELATSQCDLYFTAEQAHQLIMLCTHVVGKIDCLARIMPHMSNPFDCAQIVDSMLNINEKVALKLRMGSLWNCVMGYPTGFYSLDLKDPNSRLVARKISEAANFEKNFGKYESGRGDTSQHGNWENFRNGVLNQNTQLGKDLTTTWFTSKMPYYGRLKFDYVSTKPAPKGMRPIAQERMDRFLKQLNLDGDEINEPTHDYQDFLRYYGKERFQVLAEVEWRRLKESRYRRPIPIEERAPKNDDPMLVSGTKKDTNKKMGIGGRLPSAGRRRESIHLKPTLEESTEATSTVDDTTTLTTKHLGFEDEMNSGPVGTGVKVGSLTSLPSGKELSLESLTLESTTTEDVSLDKMILHPFFDPRSTGRMTTRHNQGPSERYMFCYFKLLQIQCSLCQVGLTVEQVVHLMLKFPREDMLWVSVLVTLFNNIIDTDNFYQIMDQYSQAEYLEAIHRLGYLNLINPTFPDRWYSLDMSIRDNYELCAIFARLAVVEPGNNWTNETYRRSYDVEKVYGWALPQTWVEDPGNRTGKGMRNFGIVTFNYHSVGPGLSPDWPERRALKSRVLCGSNRPY